MITSTSNAQIKELAKLQKKSRLRDEKGIFLVEGPRTVSYTHLDVYKRQLTYLRPDGKTQVTVEYNEDGSVKRLDAVVLSTQHDPDVTQEQIHEDIKKYVFDEIIPAELVDEEKKFFVNPTGRLVIGGPHGDSGLTGRKIIVDTYGGMARSLIHI